MLSDSWVFPSEAPILGETEANCVEANFKEDASEFRDVDDAERALQVIVRRCLKNAAKTKMASKDSGYDPFTLNMGQTNIVRLSLRCGCDEDLLEGDARCGEFRPFEEQQWPTYMAKRGNSVF